MKTAIDYDFLRNSHRLDSPRAVIPSILSEAMPKSLLDVGCGTGTWLKAALELGVSDVLGVDGIDVPDAELLFPRTFFRHQDLTVAWDLKRRFDVALCLEVAEHLDGGFAAQLIKCITDHSDLVYFSAASPGQPGQHHVHCQWPDYWQGLFNSFGYVCSDQVRWEIWDDVRVEPWYRQNLFTARRDAVHAGKESRIRRVTHPDLLTFFGEHMTFSSWSENKRRIERGDLPVRWYMTVPFRAALSKVNRCIKKLARVEGNSNEIQEKSAASER
jgi:SAM-dependent methyltransferase